MSCLVLSDSPGADAGRTSCWPRQEQSIKPREKQTQEPPQPRVSRRQTRKNAVQKNKENAKMAIRWLTNIEAKA